MSCQYKLSCETKNYLNRFYEVLDDMIATMMDAPLTDSISHNFIEQMIPHHQAAIEMSQSVLKYTNLAPLQVIAAGIIATQTNSMEDMRSVLATCREEKSSEQDLNLYQRRFDQITQTMFTNMENARITNNISANFMREMIPHHRGAVQLSENALHFELCPGLRPILQNIMTSQKAGIRKMECLLRCMYTF